MKNLFKIAFVALAVSLTVSACGSKKEEAPAVDTVAVDTAAVDTAAADTAAADTAAHAAEAPAAHGH